MNVDHNPLHKVSDKHEVGKISFKNPLVLDHISTDSHGWKKNLSDMFGGHTGKKLSDKVKNAGHDGIITMDKYGPSETVNLSGNKRINESNNMPKETQDKIDALLKQNSDEESAAKKSGKPYINSELSKSIRQLRLSLRPKTSSDPFGDNKGYGQGRYMGDSVEVSNHQPLIKENQMKTLKQIKESLTEGIAPDEMMSEATKSVASGEWHVLKDGKIHATHPTYRKAQNAANKLNDKHYDENENNPDAWTTHKKYNGEVSHKTMHMPYSYAAASHHIAEATEQKSHIDPMAQYKRNEDQNYHSENVAHIANHVGSREDRIMADHIASAHNSIGHLPKELADHRQALNAKLWPKFKAKFGE